jgi:hypothetical protein
MGNDLKEGLMQVQTRATLVEPGTFDDSFTAVISRQELEAAAADDSAELWFEIGSEGSDEVSRLSIDLAYADIEAILRLAAEDEIFVTLDGDAIGSLFADPDVEAHGLRGALAIAVTSAAILAPATQAATPQASNPAATAQKASAAATVQRATTAQSTAQASTTQVSSLAARTQVASLQAKPQVSKTLVAKASGLKLLKAGLAGR